MPAAAHAKPLELAGRARPGLGDAIHAGTGRAFTDRAEQPEQLVLGAFADDSNATIALVRNPADEIELARLTDDVHPEPDTLDPP
jgi:hypothetical protein